MPTSYQGKSYTNFDDLIAAREKHLQARFASFWGMPSEEIIKFLQSEGERMAWLPSDAHSADDVSGQLLALADFVDTRKFAERIVRLRQTGEIYVQSASGNSFKNIPEQSSQLKDEAGEPLWRLEQIEVKAGRDHRLLIKTQFNAMNDAAWAELQAVFTQFASENGIKWYKPQTDTRHPAYGPLFIQFLGQAINTAVDNMRLVVRQDKDQGDYLTLASIRKEHFVLTDNGPDLSKVHAINGGMANFKNAKPAGRDQYMQADGVTPKDVEAIQANLTEIGFRQLAIEELEERYNGSVPEGISKSVCEASLALLSEKLDSKLVGDANWPMLEAMLQQTLDASFAGDAGEAAANCWLTCCLCDSEQFEHKLVEEMTSALAKETTLLGLSGALASSAEQLAKMEGALTLFKKFEKSILSTLRMYVRVGGTEDALTRFIERYAGATKDRMMLLDQQTVFNDVRGSAYSLPQTRVIVRVLDPRHPNQELDALLQEYKIQLKDMQAGDDAAGVGYSSLVDLVADGFASHDALLLGGLAAGIHANQFAPELVANSGLKAAREKSIELARNACESLRAGEAKQEIDPGFSFGKQAKGGSSLFAAAAPTREKAPAAEDRAQAMEVDGQQPTSPKGLNK